MALAITACGSLNAATLIWDPAQTGTGSNGSGAWDNATANWATGSGNVAYSAAAQTTITAQANAGSTTLTVANAAGLSVGQFIWDPGARFPAGTTITEINGNVITLSAASTGGNLNTNSTVVFTAGDSVTFGSGTGAAGTVTVTGSQFADAMTINAADGGGSYNFTGGNITLGARNGSTGTLTVNSTAAISSAFNWKNITFATGGQTLTLSGGSTSGSVISAFNGSVTGNNAANAATSTLAITAGTYTTGGAGNTVNIGDQAAETGGLQMSGGTINTSGNFQIGAERSAFANITGGIINSFGQFTIGRNSTGNIAKVVVNGGLIQNTSTSTSDTTFAIGRGNGIGTLDVRSGTVNVIGNGITGNAGGIMALNVDGNTAAAKGTLNISNGSVTVKELRLNGGNNVAGQASAGSSSVNISGGSLYVGGIVRNSNTTTTDGGITNYGTGTTTYEINLTGGLIGANANWSSNLNMTLGNAMGAFAFQAADVGGIAHDITLSGILSGVGGFTKTGDGKLTLQGANTYAGNTIVNQGSFTLDTMGSLTFYIGDSGVNNSILGTGLIDLLGTFNFDLTNAASLGSWTIIDMAGNNVSYGDDFSVNGWTELDDGVWSLGDYTFDQATGLLTSIVPEPSRALLLMGGVLALVLRRKRTPPEQSC